MTYVNWYTRTNITLSNNKCSLFCFVVAICDLVHDGETVFYLSYVITASRNLFFDMSVPVKLQIAVSRALLIYQKKNPVAVIT